KGIIMVVIKFPDRDTQDEAVGFLASFFSGRMLHSGEVIVPEEALAALANEDFSFTVTGRATHEQMAAFRGPPPRKVQRRKAGSAKKNGGGRRGDQGAFWRFQFRKTKDRRFLFARRRPVPKKAGSLFRRCPRFGKKPPVDEAV